METKFTPGPWHTAQEVDGGYAGTLSWIRGGPKNRGIAKLTNQCRLSVFNIPPVERQANARLIAAAPELLEALQRLVKDFDDSVGHDPIWLKMADHARNAIKKAIGEAEGKEDEF